VKRICFGTLFVLMYQARAQGVKNETLCDAILAPFGSGVANNYDTTFIGHLKNGHDAVPQRITTPVRECNVNDAVYGVEHNLLPMIKDSMRRPLVFAILSILKEDTSINPDSQVGWMNGFTKEAVLTADSLDITYLLTSIIRFSILETDNQECADGIKEIPKEYVKSFVGYSGSLITDERGIVLRSPSVVLTYPVEKQITDAEIMRDVDALKDMLSKYKKPEQIPVPFNVDDSEMTYVEALYDAYASAEGVSKYTRRDVDRSKYKKDFAYQRKCYYATETIRRSLQDALLPIEYAEFDEMRDEVAEGIHPDLVYPYDNGFLRLCAATKSAAAMTISRSQIALLPGWIGPAEKVGMCHMLANIKEIQWVDDNDNENDI